MDDGKQKNRLKVKIFGEEYIIKSDASPESMQKAADRVDRLMTAIYQNNTWMSRERVAVLTAINLADELQKQKPAPRRYPEMTKEKGEEDDELV